MGEIADLEGNGRATIREVHSLLQEMRTDITGRIESVQAGIGDQLRKLIETVQTMATSQAHTNGAVEARVTALEQARVSDVAARTSNRAAMIGALVLGAIDAGLALLAVVRTVGH